MNTKSIIEQLKNPKIVLILSPITALLYITYFFIDYINLMPPHYYFEFIELFGCIIIPFFVLTLLFVMAFKKYKLQSKSVKICFYVSLCLLVLYYLYSIIEEIGLLIDLDSNGFDFKRGFLSLGVYTIISFVSYICGAAIPAIIALPIKKSKVIPLSVLSLAGIVCLTINLTDNFLWFAFAKEELIVKLLHFLCISFLFLTLLLFSLSQHKPAPAKAAPATPAVSASLSPVDELYALKAQFDNGEISESEFTARRAEIISRL